jgi:tetratricopeptide (TPR) repeat protein
VRAQCLAAVAAFGFVIAALPASVKADFGGICGKVGGCVDPPRGGDTDDWVWEQPQQLFLAYLGNAQQAMRDGNWDSAEGWAQRALKEQPGNAEAQAILSQLAYARKRRAALAVNDAGVQLSNSGDYAAAAAKFREALALDPGDALVQKNLDYVNARLQVAAMANAAEAAAATERLNHQARMAAAQRAADDTARKGIENLAGRVAGLAWSPCSGLACAQLAAGVESGRGAASSDHLPTASDLARFPFDDRGGSITVIQPGQTAPVTLPPRALTGEAAELRDNIAALHEEETKLEQAIKSEGDAVKRANLIQKQTVVRSKKQVETIKLATFTARFAPDKGQGK